MSGRPQNLPPWATAGGGPPPEVLSLFGGSMPSGDGTEPPTSILAQLTALTKNAAASTLSPSSIVTGLRTGLTPSPGMTGPPAGISFPSGVTGPLAGFGIPTDMTGPPPGVTGMPPGAMSGGGDSGPYVNAHKRALTPEQSWLVIGITAMLLVLCVAAVGGRLLARRLSRVRIATDDWFCIVTFACFLGFCIEQFLMCHYGVMMGPGQVPNFNLIRKFAKLQFGSEIMYSIVTCFAKAAVLALYQRLFSLRTRWFRILWWTYAVLVAVYLVLLIVLQRTTCIPVHIIWDQPGSCLPDIPRMAAMGFLNAALDLMILILPIRTVWSLQMATKRKWAVSAVFGLGTFAVAISIARAAMIANPKVFRTGGVNFIIWSNVEPAVALICSCLPVLRPLYISGFAKITSRGPWSWYQSRKSKSYGTSGGSGGTSGSSGKNGAQSDLTEPTLRSVPNTISLEKKSWLKSSDAEIGVRPLDDPYSNASSPISPLDKPLPPAYAPPGHGDTGYHTWSWNLLSRPRDENKTPSLSRRTLIEENGHPFRISSTYPDRSTSKRVPTIPFRSKSSSNCCTPPQLKTHTPILDRDPAPHDRTQHDPLSPTPPPPFSPGSFGPAPPQTPYPLTWRDPKSGSGSSSPAAAPPPPPIPPHRNHSHSFSYNYYAKAVSDRSVALPSPLDSPVSSAPTNPARPKPVARTESRLGRGQEAGSRRVPKLSVRTNYDRNGAKEIADSQPS